MNYLTQYYKNRSEQLQEQLNNLQKIYEIASLPPTQFSVAPDSFNPSGAPGDNDVIDPTLMPTYRRTGSWDFFHVKHPWNWSPEGGWPDGTKKTVYGKTWVYDKETDTWYVYGKDGQAYERIPHGRPDRYWQGPDFSAQPQDLPDWLRQWTN